MKLEFPFPVDSLTIRLQRFPGLGPEIRYDILITGLGEVTVEEIDEGVISKQSKIIPASEVLKLLKSAIDCGFFEMPDVYETEEKLVIEGNVVILEGWLCTDLPTKDLTITAGNQTKSVRDYLGAPVRLKRLQSKIKKLAGCELQ